MEEKKLTDEEIVKAFSNCADHNDCCECPLWEEMKRRNCVCREIVLGVIHRLQSENELLKNDYLELDLECRELRTKNDEIEKQLADKKAEEGEIYEWAKKNIFFGK